MANIVKAAQRVLAAAEKPLDSYQLGRRIGCTPMDAARTLQELQSGAQVIPSGVGGDQHLAEEFTLA